MSREYTRRLSIIGDVPAFGEVVLFDDFESSLVWTKAETAGDTIFELDITTLYSGNHSLHLKTRTTDSAEDDFIRASRRFPSPPSGLISMALLFLCPDFTPFKSLKISINVQTATSTKALVFQYDIINGVFQYRNSDGGFTNITDLTLTLAPLFWHLLRFTADPTAGFYKYFNVNEYSHYPVKIPIYEPSNGAALSSVAHIEIITAGAAPAELFINTFLIHET